MKTQIVNKFNRGGYTSLNSYKSESYLRNSLIKTWILNKATGTNGIACWNDLSSTYFNKGTGTLCPTKSAIEAAVKSGYSAGISSGYSSNQLVKYSDIIPKSLTYDLLFYFYAKNYITSCYFNNVRITQNETVIKSNATTLIDTYNGSVEYNSYATNEVVLSVNGDCGYGYFAESGNNSQEMDTPKSYGFTVVITANADPVIVRID